MRQWVAVQAEWDERPATGSSFPAGAAAAGEDAAEGGVAAGQGQARAEHLAAGPRQ